MQTQIQDNSIKTQTIIYGILLSLIIFTFPLRAMKRPIGTFDSPILGNSDLVFFATDAPDNLIVYSPSIQDNLLILPASERLSDMIVSRDGRVVWTATKSGFIDRYEIPIEAKALQPKSSIHRRIAPVLSSIALSADERWLAVAYANTEDYNSRNFKVIRASTIDPKEERADVSVSGDIQAIVANPVRNLFYIINAHSDRVRIYNADKPGFESDIIELGSSPGRFNVSPDGKLGYGAMNARQALAIVDLDTNNVIKTQILGFPPYAMCFNPDGSRLYVASRDSTSVAVIDVAKNEIIKSFDLNPRLRGILEFNFAEIIGVSSDEKYLYVMPKRPEFLIYDISEVMSPGAADDIQPKMIQSKMFATDPFAMEVIRLEDIKRSSLQPSETGQ